MKQRFQAGNCCPSSLESFLLCEPRVLNGDITDFRVLLMSHDLPSCLSELKNKTKLFLSITDVLKFHRIALLELVFFRHLRACLWTSRLKMQVLQTREKSFH